MRAGSSPARGTIHLGIWMKYPYATLNMCLKSMLGSQELVDKWYESPNRAFGMQTPLQMLESGDEPRKTVYKYILAQLNYIPQ